MSAKFGKAARIFQKFDDFFQLFARFVNASNVCKGDLALAFGKHFGLALAKAHCPASAAALLHLAQYEKGNAQDQNEWQRLDKDIGENAHFLFLSARIGNALFFEQSGERGIASNRNSAKFVAIGERSGDQILRNLCLFDGPLSHFAAEVRIGNWFANLFLRAAKCGHRYQKRKEDAAPNEQALNPRVRAIFIGSIRATTAIVVGGSAGLILVAHALNFLLV